MNTFIEFILWVAGLFVVALIVIVFIIIGGEISDRKKVENNEITLEEFCEKQKFMTIENLPAACVGYFGDTSKAVDN